MSDENITAAGGWCTPFEMLYTVDALEGKFTLPEIEVARDGIGYHVPTPAERAAAEAMRAQVNRYAEERARERAEAIRLACVVAMENDWDLHLWTHPETNWVHHMEMNAYRPTTYIGIEFRPAKYPIPTIIEHLGYDFSWTDDDEWEN